MFIQEVNEMGWRENTLHDGTPSDEQANEKVAKRNGISGNISPSPSTK